MKIQQTEKDGKKPGEVKETRNGGSASVFVERPDDIDRYRPNSHEKDYDDRWKMMIIADPQTKSRISLDWCKIIIDDIADWIERSGMDVPEYDVSIDNGIKKGRNSIPIDQNLKAFYALLKSKLSKISQEIFNKTRGRVAINLICAFVGETGTLITNIGNCSAYIVQDGKIQMVAIPQSVESELETAESLKIYPEAIPFLKERSNPVSFIGANPNEKARQALRYYGDERYYDSFNLQGIIIPNTYDRLLLSNSGLELTRDLSNILLSEKNGTLPDAIEDVASAPQTIKMPLGLRQKLIVGRKDGNEEMVKKELTAKACLPEVGPNPDHQVIVFDVGELKKGKNQEYFRGLKAQEKQKQEEEKRRQYVKGEVDKALERKRREAEKRRQESEGIDIHEGTSKSVSDEE